MQVAVDFEGVHVGGHVHDLRDKTVLLVVAEGVHGTDEGRYVAAGFAGEVVVDGPEVGAPAGPPDGFVDIAGAAVVGGDGQVPVAEDAVGVLQVAGGCIGGFERVEAFIDVGVDFQPVTLGRGVHELPHTLCAGAGDGDGVEGGFDDCHVLEFLRHIVFVEGLLEDGHVVIRQAEHDGHLGWHLLGVEDHVVLDRLVVGEGDVGVHVGQPFEEDRIRYVRGEMDGVHVVLDVRGEVLHIGAQPAALVPEVEQAVHHVGRIVLRGEAGAEPVLVFFVDFDDFCGDAVTGVVHLLHVLDLLAQGFQFRLHFAVFFLELLAGLRDLDQGLFLRLLFLGLLGDSSGRYAPGRCGRLCRHRGEGGQNQQGEEYRSYLHNH